MTQRFYPIQAHANFLAAIWDFTKFLINDGHALTGPNWKVEEAYDGGYGGVKRQVPGDPHDLDTFPAGYSWRTGILNVGDWIVLESQTGVAGTMMQVYLEYDSTTVLKTAMIPLDNWNTVLGGADATPPTFPAGAVGDGGAFPAALISMTAYVWNAQYTIVADEAMMAMIFDDAASASFIYIGEAAPARLTGVPPDDRPYVIVDSTLCYWSNAAIWNRLSAIDDVTILTTGYQVEFYAAGTGAAILSSGYDVNPLGLWLILPAGVYFHDAGHRHFVGFLLNVGSCNGDKGTKGTIDSMNWMYRNTGGAGTRGICLAWDGATAV